MSNDQAPSRTEAEIKAQQKEFYAVHGEFARNCGFLPSMIDMWLIGKGLMDTKGRALRAADRAAAAEPVRHNGSISFEEAQQMARKHAKAEPESYYSEPFDPHLWVIYAVIEASAMWYGRAVAERIRRVRAEAVRTSLTPRSTLAPIFEVRITGSDDVMPFSDEMEAHRAANTINTMDVADRLENLGREVLCVATVHQRGVKS